MKKRELPFDIQMFFTIKEHSYKHNNKMETDLTHLVGKRVRLIEMVNPPNEIPDPNPIPSGSEGVVNHTGNDIINVEWDNGRNLGMAHGTDRYVVLD